MGHGGGRAAGGRRTARWIGARARRRGHDDERAVATEGGVQRVNAWSPKSAQRARVLLRPRPASVAERRRRLLDVHRRCGDRRQLGAYRPSTNTRRAIRLVDHEAATSSSSRRRVAGSAGEKSRLGERRRRRCTASPRRASWGSPVARKRSIAPRAGAVPATDAPPPLRGRRVSEALDSAFVARDDRCVELAAAPPCPRATARSPRPRARAPAPCRPIRTMRPFCSTCTQSGTM